MRSSFDKGRFARRDESRKRDLQDATFGRGPLAGRTGDPFKDDPFFNPWAPGGSFDPFAAHRAGGKLGGSTSVFRGSTGSSSAGDFSLPTVYIPHVPEIPAVPASVLDTFNRSATENSSAPAERKPGLIGWALQKFGF